MASFMQSFTFLYLLFLVICSSSSNQQPKPYVVYMGSSSNGDSASTSEVSKLAHLQLLSSVIPSKDSERISLLHCYNHAFKGFSAMLTVDEAFILSGHTEILSVFPDHVLKLHTTRSWDFMDAESGIIRSSSNHHYQHISSDVIIGMIDTGIWPESRSFNDEGIGEIPSKWKGVCMEGSDFKKSNCNRKLIGARYYNIQDNSIQLGNKTGHVKPAAGSPRDFDGHGTHTASIAAGALVANASYYGLAEGAARGGSPSTRIASYKACSMEGCSGSTILKAIDDAVKDGVDIISISIGMSSVFQFDFLKDPLAIGAFHAEQMGVLVVCSGGNDGPDPYTVVNSAPWVITVAASTIDRDFNSSVLLGNGKTYQGSAISFSNLTRTMTYPLAFGENVAAAFTPATEARICYPGSLNSSKVVGKVIVCVNNDASISRKIMKLVVEDAGAKGLILIDEAENRFPFDSGSFPFTEVGNIAGLQILKYINSTKNPTATIYSTIEVPRYKPAPVVAYFSARGPAGLTENILKPDIMAPGVAILAATIPNREGSGPIGKQQQQQSFRINSGTSMACPHVTGAAAFIKSIHHGWSSSMIKSALMTTATVYGNNGKPLTNSSGYLANPHETGVGEVSPLKALHPGLVFETTRKDYLQFLCYYGYPQKTIRSISNTNFNCPKNFTERELISNINYPSISIAKLKRHQGPRVVERTVTNVGPPNSTYIVSVEAPKGLTVRVSLTTLVFTKGLRRASFNVSFDGKKATTNYNFGAITWSDGVHIVRMIFAVNVE